MFEAVIFDMDGVIVDTEGLKVKVWLTVLEDIKLKLTKEDFYRYLGSNKWEIKKDIEKRYGISIGEDLIREKDDLILKRFTEGKIDTMHHVRESIKFFIDKGFKIAIASASSMEEIRIKMKSAGLEGLFKVVVSSDDVEACKPDPEIYIKAAKMLETEPKKCIAFEDTEPGVLAAKRAGMTCFAVYTEMTKNQDLSMADGKFRDMEKALDHIKKEYNL